MTADTSEGLTWTERLRQAAASGTPVDLPHRIAEDQTDYIDIGDAPLALQIPAQDIRAFLMEPALKNIDPRGLIVQGVIVTGALDLDYANAPCRMVFTQCRFENIPSFQHANLPGLVLEDVVLPGLLLSSARIAGEFGLTGLRSTGGVSAQNIHVGGQLDLSGADLSNPDGTALDLDGAHISGDAFLDGLAADGEVRACGAHIGGQLILKGADLSNPGGVALNLGGVDIKDGAFADGLEATGEVRARGAHIGGQLDLSEADLSNPGGIALDLDGADIKRGAFVDGLAADGEVRALGVRIGGQLILKGAKFSHPGGIALNLDGADISGDAFLDGLEATGEVRAAGANIAGLWVLEGAKLSNRGGSALTLDGTDIAGGLGLGRLMATGEVRAAGARIGGQLILKGAKLSNPAGNALDLSSAILEELILDDAFTTAGTMDLSFASIRVLAVGETRPAKGLPPLYSAQGWTLGTVHGFLRTNHRSASAWLDTVDTNPPIGGRKEFASQPWKEMAKIYDQVGQPEDARRLRFRAARRTTRVAPLPSKLVRWPYAAVVGYGYYPLIVIGWLAALWLTVLMVSSLNASAFTPSDLRVATITVPTNNGPQDIRVTGATQQPPPNYPRFDPILFAMDTAIPAAATGQTNAWRVTENAQMSSGFAAIKGFAWLLTALLLAGITGILRKD